MPKKICVSHYELISRIISRFIRERINAGRRFRGIYMKWSHKIDFHNGRLFFGESLQKPPRQTNFRRSYICRVPYVHRHMETSVCTCVYVCACVMEYCAPNATARHHICRNIRLVHTGEIRFTVAARMQVSRVSLAHRRESHTARKYSRSSSYVILSASVYVSRGPMCKM